MEFKKRGQEFEIRPLSMSKRRNQKAAIARPTLWGIVDLILLSLYYSVVKFLDFVQQKASPPP
jgi:hypothetical protein